MAMEIERKFLVTAETWRASADAGRRMSQGYLTRGDGPSIRVRVAGDDAWLNVKQPVSLTVRREFEYPVPLDDALELMQHACVGGRVEKTRYLVPCGPHVFEVDVFHGENEGLVVAEVELTREDEAFEKPAWLGTDVSEDPRYLNQRLAKVPFTRWQAEGS
jgi:adenylate cyclase